MVEPRQTWALWWTQIVREKRRGPNAMALWLISVPYFLATSLRNQLFQHGWKRTHQAPVPVVSVGNLTLGGTGKTPMVEWVAGQYRDRGVQACILSRGYGNQQSANDEALVLEENLPDVPHLQGADRVALAATAVEELEAEILVLDDGFQHRRLRRDFDIVLIDVTWPPFQDRLFPAGTLREPIAGLQRAHAFVLTRCDQGNADEVESWLRLRYPTKLIAKTKHAPIAWLSLQGEPEPVQTFKGRTVGVISGIGNPKAFAKTLTSLGMTIAAERIFPDHHAYSRSDIEALQTWAQGLPADAIVVTTQKDWVKLQIAELGGKIVRALRVGLQFIQGEEELRLALEQVEVAKTEPNGF